MTGRSATMTSQRSRSGRNWGLFIVGLLVALGGFVFLFWPGASLIAITQVAGALLIVGGIFDFVAYSQDRKYGTQTGWAIVNGICCILLGLMFLVHPIVSAAVLPFLVGVFVTAYAIVSIIAAFGMRNLGSIWGFMLANGLVSLLCGIMFITMPASFVIFLGVFMIMRGVTMCVYGVTTNRSDTLFV